MLLVCYWRYRNRPEDCPVSLFSRLPCSALHPVKPFKGTIFPVPQGLIEEIYASPRMWCPPSFGTLRTAAMRCPGISESWNSLLPRMLTMNLEQKRRGLRQECLVRRGWKEVICADASWRPYAQILHCWGIYASKGPSS